MNSELGALLVVRRLCLPCLADKTGLVAATARVRIAHLGTLIVVREFESTCEGCRTVTVTYGV